jgi:hypothetical protein
MRSVDQQLSAWTTVSTAFAAMRRVECAEREGEASRVSIYRSRLVPIEDLPRLLIAADVHLITLRDPFVGYVLPSKIHACIDSGKRLLFVGSERSDIHLLARRALPSGQYHRVDVGDVDGLVAALHATEWAVASGRKSGVPQIDQCPSVDRIPAPGSFATEHGRIS